MLISAYTTHQARITDPVARGASGPRDTRPLESGKPGGDMPERIEAALNGRKRKSIVENSWNMGFLSNTSVNVTSF